MPILNYHLKFSTTKTTITWSSYHKQRPNDRLQFFSLHLYISFFFFFNFLATPLSTWDLSSSTRDQIHTPSIGRRSLNGWTTGEVPWLSFSDNVHCIWVDSEETLGLCIYLFLRFYFCFRAVFSSQKNWEEDADSPSRPSAPPHAQASPHCQYPEGCIYYSWWL